MMHRLIASLVMFTALPALAQDRALRWQNLDPETTRSVLQKLDAAEFDLMGMRPLSLIVPDHACRAGCTVRDAGCACPKSEQVCDAGTVQSPGGALCSGPLSGVSVMLEDGRVSGPIDLP